jgi:hypothetical protein
MDLASLSEAEKAELNARLSAIDMVSWEWNAKGVALRAADKRFAKLENRKEVGVIAQNVRDELSEFFPDITPHHETGALMVDYGLLADIARAVLEFLDTNYQKAASHAKPSGERLELKQLLKKYQTDDPQLAVVRLLALVKLYNQKLAEIQ